MEPVPASKEPKFRPGTLIVCFTEGQKPEEVLSTVSAKSRGAVSAAGIEIKRLLDIKPVVEKQKVLLGVKAKSAVNEEDLFKQAYEKMPLPKKKLYRTYTLTLPEGSDLEATRLSLHNDKRVQFVGLDYLAELFVSSNDPYYSELWAMPKIEAPAAWDISQGEDVIVAVVDTGIDYNHPDIQPNLWTDGYGNFGYDFSDWDSDVMDYHGHGTHVAGTIAAVLNNYEGVAGVAPKAKIMTLKIFPWAYSSNILQAWVWGVDNGAKVFNNSWGYYWPNYSDPTLEAAADYVYAMGGIIIMAAGNSGDVTANYSPQNHPKTISVAATDQWDNRAYFSNYGPETDVAAPGVDILSLAWGGGYQYMSGTSMACPHVVGQAALLLAKNPKMTYEEVRDTIVNAADPIVTDLPIGSGRINLIKPLKVQTNCVAFSATGVTHVSMGADLQLKYANEILNESGAWNGTEFVAPAAGVYHFNIHFVKDALFHKGTLESVSIHLSHNGTYVGKAWCSEGSGYAGSGSFAANLKLAKGDVVTTWVWSDHGDKRHVPYYSFCGHLVCAA